eukprot:m.336571 g.336571  ORF g.336571 m.336571 type:complete len:586 (+) comp20539_c0_seq3:227-1984(+)
MGTCCSRAEAIEESSTSASAAADDHVRFSRMDTAEPERYDFFNGKGTVSTQCSTLGSSSSACSTASEFSGYFGDASADGDVKPGQLRQPNPQLSVQVAPESKSASLSTHQHASEQPFSPREEQIIQQSAKKPSYMNREIPPPVSPRNESLGIVFDFPEIDNAEGATMMQPPMNRACTDIDTTSSALNETHSFTEDRILPVSQPVQIQSPSVVLGHSPAPLSQHHFNRGVGRTEKYDDCSGYANPKPVKNPRRLDESFTPVLHGGAADCASHNMRSLNGDRLLTGLPTSRAEVNNRNAAMGQSVHPDNQSELDLPLPPPPSLTYIAPPPQRHHSLPKEDGQIHDNISALVVEPPPEFAALAGSDCSAPTKILPKYIPRAEMDTTPLMYTPVYTDDDLEIKDIKMEMYHQPLPDIQYVPKDVQTGQPTLYAPLAKHVDVEDTAQEAVSIASASTPRQPTLLHTCTRVEAENVLRYCQGKDIQNIYIMVRAKDTGEHILSYSLQGKMYHRLLSKPSTRMVEDHSTGHIRDTTLDLLREYNRAFASSYPRMNHLLVLSDFSIVHLAQFLLTNSVQPTGKVVEVVLDSIC